MRDINLAPLGSEKRSKRVLLLVGLFCVVFGFLMLTVVLFMKPEVKRPQLVGKRIRLPITSIEKKEQPPIPGAVEEERMEEKPLEGRKLKEEKPIVSEPSEPSIMVEEREVGNKKVFILGEEEAPKEEEVSVAEGEGKRPEIEGKLPTGMYTLNIASFRDKANADRLMKELEEKGYAAFVEKANIPQKGTWYRVAVGRFSSRGEALTFAQELKKKGINYSFVRKLKEEK